MPDGFFMFTYVLLWILVASLYAAVILLYRYLGTTLQVRANQGPSVNQKALAVELRELTGQPFVMGTATGRFQFVFFGTASCGYCAEAIPVVTSLANRYHDRVQTVVVYKGEENILQRVRRHLPVDSVFLADFASESFFKWDVKSTPFSVLIDPEGIVRKKGFSGDREALESFFQVTES